MIFRSIKWRLQLWHAVILLTVLLGFGYTAFELQRTREYRRVDQELHDHMAALLGPLRPRGRPPMRRDGTLREPLRGPESLRPKGVDPEEPGPPDRVRPQPGIPPEIGVETDGAFPDEGLFYFAVWDRQGRMIRSRNLPEKFLPRHGGARGPINSRGEYRELTQITPRAETVVVGRSISVEVKELQNLALILVASGAGILALGLAGGWIVGTRTLAPIDTISQTAQKIASGDLAQRIPQAETESELGRLVAVLNSTFARLEAAFSDQVRFTTDVSHELRTPVSVIVSQTQMALGRERPAAEYREALEACQRAAQRMRRLIESLMQLARLDAGQEEIRRLTFDLGQTAAETAELLRALAEEKKVELVLETTAVQTLGDPDKISQVVTNLVSNAIAYTPAGGRVSIIVHAENQLAVLSVADTGVGIPTEDLPHLFSRFYRVDTSRSRDKGGSGLGLAITRAIVHAHGGTVDVESALEKGTKFVVRLPLGPQIAP